MDRVVSILRQIKITGDQYASNKLFYKLLQVIGDNKTDYGQPAKHHLNMICEILRDSTISQSSTKSTFFDTGNSTFDLSEIIFRMSFWLTKFLHKISDDFTSDKSLLPAYYINIVAIYAAIILQLYKCERCISSTQECTNYNDKPMKRDGDQLALHADHNVSRSCLCDKPTLKQANVVRQVCGDAQTMDVDESTSFSAGSPVAGCSRYDNELSVTNKATATSQSSTPVRSKKRRPQPSFAHESSSDTSVDSIPVLATSALDSNKLAKHNKFYKQKRSPRLDNRNTVHLNFDKDTTLTMNTTTSNAKISFSVRHILSSPTEDDNQEKLNINNQLQDSDDCNVDNKQDDLQTSTIATSSNTNSDKSVIASSSDKSSSHSLTSNPIPNLNYTQDRNMSNLASPVTTSAQSGGANSQQFAVNLLPMAYCYQMPNVFPASVYAPVQVHPTRENYPYFQMASSTSNKMYQCNICLKVFTRSYSLTRHKRIHTCERPYKCKECGKSFSQSYHLKIHIRIHSRDAEN